MSSMEKMSSQANGPLMPASGRQPAMQTRVPQRPRNLPLSEGPKGLSAILLDYVRPRKPQISSLTESQMRAELAAIRQTIEMTPGQQGARSFLLSIAREQALRGFLARGAIPRRRGAR
jgi:hypothetical protein